MTQTPNAVERIEIEREILRRNGPFDRSHPTIG